MTSELLPEIDRLRTTVNTVTPTKRDDCIEIRKIHSMQHRSLHIFLHPLVGIQHNIVVGLPAANVKVKGPNAQSRLKGIIKMCMCAKRLVWRPFMVFLIFRQILQ